MADDLLVTFPTPLRRGRIVGRRNRFILDVKTRPDARPSATGQGNAHGAETEGSVQQAHCPTTGRIGDFVLAGLDCLLSSSQDTTRKTAFTVEAVGLPDTRTGDLTWVGINQNAANRYIEAALTAGALNAILPVHQVRREARLGKSRLDFLVNGDTYIEVKTPLQTVQVPTPPELDPVLRRTVPAFNSTDRLVRHVNELAGSLDEHERAILLTCFLYNNPGFQTTPSARKTQVTAAISAGVARGVELWQVNLPLTPTGISWPTVTPLDLLN